MSHALYAAHFREHFANHGDGRGTDEHDEDAGENEDHQREDQLHGGFGGLFFGHLTPPGAQRVALRSQRLRHAGAEFVGLDEHGRQRAEIGNAGARAEFVQHFDARPAHLQLEIADREFFGQHAIGVFHFFGDFAHGLIQSQAGFHANDHQIQGVGQGEKNGLFAIFSHEPDDEIGQIEQQAGQAHRSTSADF